MEMASGGARGVDRIGERETAFERTRRMIMIA